MKIAILGAGFAGIASTWHLLQDKTANAQITVFDENGLGGGASGVSAGLLHPFAGLHAKLNPFGIEGFHATKQLLTVAAEHLGKPVADYTGVLRLAFTDQQKKGYADCAASHSDLVKWLSPAETCRMIPGIASAPGIFIPSGITVYSTDYLKGLWIACEKQGAMMEKRRIHTLSELKGFTTIIVAMGASCTSLPELANLPINAVKGQILELEWPQDLAPLPMSLNSQIYCIMLPEKDRCLAGSTYERNFSSPDPDVAIAVKEIIPKLEALYPPLCNAKIIACRSGVRASTPDHLPFIRKVANNSWAIAGFGSKGLLYHALYAQRLVQELMCSSS